MRFYSSAKEFGQPIYMTALTEMSGALWELVIIQFITQLTDIIMVTTLCFSIGYLALCVILMNGRRQHMRRLRSKLADLTFLQIHCLLLLFPSIGGCDSFEMVVQRFTVKLSFESNISDNTCLGAEKRPSLRSTGSPFVTIVSFWSFRGLRQQTPFC